MSCNSLAKDIDEAIVAIDVDPSSKFVFTLSGTAYSIPFSGLIDNLGVTGTLTPVGAATSVAILTKPTVGDNKIAGILGVNGVVATTDEQGSINIGNNFIFAGGDYELIKSLSSSAYEFRGFTAGEGIDLGYSDNGNSIVISSSAGTGSSKTIIVNSMSDFPTAIAGVITLADGYDYIVSTTLTTTNRFYCAGSSVIRSVDRSVVSLVYAGIGTMFTLLNGSLTIKNINIICNTGTMFSSVGSSTGSFRMFEAAMRVKNAGTCDGLSRFSVQGLVVSNILDSGFVFSGSGLQVLIDTLLVSNISAGSIFDLGTATFSRLGLQSITVSDSAGGTVFLSGLASSGNIEVGSLAIVTGVSLSGSIANFTGVSSEDTRFDFSACNTIPTTRPDALYRLDTEESTVINTVSVAERVSGTFTSLRSSQINVSANNRFTYEGSSGVVVPIDVNIIMAPTSGSSSDLAVVLYKNDVEMPLSSEPLNVSAGSAKAVSLIWQDRLDNGDYYDIYVRNDSSANDVVVSSCRVRVN